HDTAPAEIYHLSLHDALPIWRRDRASVAREAPGPSRRHWHCRPASDKAGDSVTGTEPDIAKLVEQLAQHDSSDAMARSVRKAARSEEHTSELQSRENLVCRLL